MKKRILIVILILAITLVIGLVLYNNRTVSTIIMDINPSIKINLNKKNKVKRVIPLNDDAKDITKGNYRGKNLEETFTSLTEKIVKSGYVKEDHVIVVLYTEGSILLNDVEEKLNYGFNENNVGIDIIKVENVTKEDKKLAKKYNISPSKAAYINSIKGENANIDIETLTEKPIDELRETKSRGVYCNSGYTLEGDFCLKEIGKETPKEGLICGEGYREHNDNCYEEDVILDAEELTCHSEFELKDNKCYRKTISDAQPVKFTCEKGDAKTRSELGLTGNDAGDANYIVCVDYSNATHPVSPCEANDGTEYTWAGGTCYWHRAPVIAEGCPGKVEVNGECWDNATGIYICPGYRDGKRYSSKDEYCEHSIKYLDPIVTEYKCPKNHTLDGNKCINEEYEEQYHKKYCAEGYTLIEDRMCINLNKQGTKVNGLYCEKENSKLVNNECRIYDIVDANHS